MEIKKFEKNIEQNFTQYAKAKIFAKKISKKYFSELEEFDRIVIEDLVDHVKFCICFDSIFKESLEQIELFYVFMGWVRDSWVLDTGTFSYCDNEARIYEEFMLNSDELDRCLEKLKLQEDSEKYNL